MMEGFQVQVNTSTYLHERRCLSRQAFEGSLCHRSQQKERQRLLVLLRRLVETIGPDAKELQHGRQNGGDPNQINISQLQES